MKKIVVCPTSYFCSIFLFIAWCTSCATPSDELAPIEANLTAPEEVSHEEIDDVIDYVDDNDPLGSKDPTKEHQGEAGAYSTQTEGSDTNGNLEQESLTEGLPDEAMPLVQKWLDYFQAHPKTITRYLKRGSKYKPMMEKIFRDQGLPTDLYYLALIESGFYTKAKSHAQATGVWQFIAATGRRYGLLVDYYADERIDPMRATIAASLYLSDLNNVFHSWYLAMAAYNSGEMRVLNAIMKANSRDYWQLVQQKSLPGETRNYIPKFIAAALIGKNPEKYGINFEAEDPIDVVSVELPSPIAIKKVAKETGLSLDVLQRLNPHLRHHITPPKVTRYKLWIPKDSLAVFEEKATQIADLKIDIKKNGLAKWVPSSGYHQVKSGDTLSSIAKSYGSTIAQIKTLNGLNSTTIFPNQKLLVSEAKSIPTPSFKRYRVRKGDNLHSISQKFGTTVHFLKKLNRIRKSRIYAGQLLKVSKLSI